MLGLVQQRCLAFESGVLKCSFLRHDKDVLTRESVVETASCEGQRKFEVSRASKGHNSRLVWREPDILIQRKHDVWVSFHVRHN